MSFALGEFRFQTVFAVEQPCIQGWLAARGNLLQVGFGHFDYAAAHAQPQIPIAVVHQLADVGVWESMLGGESEDLRLCRRCLPAGQACRGPDPKHIPVWMENPHTVRSQSLGRTERGLKSVFFQTPQAASPRSSPDLSSVIFRQNRNRIRGARDRNQLFVTAELHRASRGSSPDPAGSVLQY